MELIEITKVRFTTEENIMWGNFYEFIEKILYKTTDPALDDDCRRILNAMEEFTYHFED